MKFEKPELKVTLFTLKDVLTTSGQQQEISAEGRLMEGSCDGTAADDLLDDCI